jgi:hypothetical protein
VKKAQILYWIFTILFAAFTTLTAITQIVPVQSSVEVMNILKFPLYMLPFLGFAKIAAVITVLIPNLNRMKEWAYAGLMLDFLGATYAMIAVGGTIDKWGFMVVPIVLCTLSYFYYHKRNELYRSATN